MTLVYKYSPKATLILQLNILIVPNKYFTCSLPAISAMEKVSGTELPEKVFMLPKQCKAFQEHYDHIHQALESIAGMDDLLAGN